MVSIGILIAAVVCCVLVVILGVWGSGVACPDFGMSCTPPLPAGTPAVTPPVGTPPSVGTPAGMPPPVGTPSAGTPRAGAPGGAPPALGSLGSTPDATATAPNAGAPPPSTTPTTPTTPPPTNKVNCVGYWDACSVTCGTGVQTYKISTPASGGGNACKDTDGTTPRAAGDTKPCSGPVCGVNCVGDWVKSSSTDADGWGACSATCGSGTQTRKYKITTQQAGGGNSCPKADGATETRACPNLPACAVAVNCVGAWGEWTGCSAGCGGGTRSRTYYITTPAANGGTACPKTNGQSESEACNTTPCCDAAKTGAWYDVGSVICTGSSSPDPYIYQSRAVTFPSNPTGSATAQACNITVAQVRKTAGPDPAGNKCPDRTPTGGTCSTGIAWSAGGCTAAATATPTNISCPAGSTYMESAPTSGGPGFSAGGDSSIAPGYGIYDTVSGQKYVRYQRSNPMINIPVDGLWKTNGSCSSSGWTKVDSLPTDKFGRGCYKWAYTGRSSECPSPNWTKIAASDITCPTGYNKDVAGLACNLTSGAYVNSLTCDSTYFTANNGTNKCVPK